MLEQSLPKLRINWQDAIRCSILSWVDFANLPPPRELGNSLYYYYGSNGSYVIIFAARPRYHLPLFFDVTVKTEARMVTAPRPKVAVNRLMISP
jgi:hypothetical protein